MGNPELTGRGLPIISTVVLAVMRSLVLVLMSLLPCLAWGQAATPPASLASTVINYETSLGSWVAYHTVLLELDGTFYEVADYYTGAPGSTSDPLKSGTYAYGTNSNNTGTLTLNYSDGTTLAVTMLFSGYASPNLNLIGNFAGYVAGSNFRIAPLAAAWNCINVSSRSLVSPTVPSISGFVVTGSVPRYVLVRAIGPSLAALGVTDAVASASVQVFQGSTLIGQNSGWSVPSSNVTSLTATFAQVGAFSLSPGSADAALVLLLNPGSYTVQGRATQIGEILVEVYLVP